MRHNSQLKILQNLKTQNEKKNHTKKLLMWQNSECGKTEELKKVKCDKTQQKKLEMWKNPKLRIWHTSNVTKLKTQNDRQFDFQASF